MGSSDNDCGDSTSWWSVVLAVIIVIIVLIIAGYVAQRYLDKCYRSIVVFTVIAAFVVLFCAIACPNGNGSRCNSGYDY